MTSEQMINFMLQNTELSFEERKKVCSLITDNVGFYDSAMEHEAINQKERKVKFGLYRKTLNLEELYRKDMELHRAFIIDTSIDYTRLEDEAYMVNSNSIFSYKFGIRSNDNRMIQAKRYRCRCGNLEEPISGVKCPICGTETQNIYCIRGWFLLEDFKVFEPDFLTTMLANLNKSAGSKKQILENLLTFNTRAHKKGPNILDLQSREALVSFIDTYVSDSKKEYFMSNIDCAMTSAIPVISKDYRFYTVVKKIGDEPNVNSHPLNKLYISINDSVRILNNMKGRESPAQKLACLSRITQKLLEIYAETKKILGGSKEAYIRGKIGGRRKENSGRLVVEAMKHPRVDACIVPYNFFGEFTIDQHRDLYVKYGMTAESEYRMRNNYPNKWDKIIMVKVLKELKDQHLNTMFMYRAPCIYIGSLLTFEIIGLSNNNAILIADTALEHCLHGDKDGDILGVFMLPPSIRATTFFAFNPKKSIVDPVKGKINPGFELVEGIQYIACKVLDDDNLGKVLNDEDIKRMVSNHNLTIDCNEEM